MIRGRFFKRLAIVVLGFMVPLGVTNVAMAQPASSLEGLTVEERAALRQALRDERRAERRAIRDVERAARLEAEIAFLRSRLSITPEQAPLWDAFAEALRENYAARLQDRQERRARRDSIVGPPTFPEQLEEDRMELTAGIERLNHAADTFTPLYNSLSAEQKYIADRLLDVDDGDVRIDDDDD
jgi:hypothetical protein